MRLLLRFDDSGRQIAAVEEGNRENPVPRSSVGVIMGIPGIVTTPGDSRQPFAVDQAFEVPYERGGRALDDGRPRPLPLAKFPDKKGKKKDKEEPSKGSRGTETFFRNGYRAQLELTQLADNKANIMITINGVMMSVVIVSSGVLSGQQLWLLGPAFVLLLTCLASTVYAVLAARPQIDSGRHGAEVTGDDVRNGRGILLFFGNFTQISEEDYVALMLETLKDKTRVYSQMAHHIYRMGEGLRRKFRLLHMSYTVFIIGLSLSIAIFISSFLVFRGA
jgi:hypothetical protein